MNSLQGLADSWRATAKQLDEGANKIRVALREGKELDEEDKVNYVFEMAAQAWTLRQCAKQLEDLSREIYK